MNEIAQMLTRLIVLYFVIVVVSAIILAGLRMSPIGPVLFTVLAIAFVIYALSALQKKK